ncbi:Uncharacterised protein [Bordetella trematum]|uniref:hypothetical protein n=1 Tax=Bordetella trematum TaxID=123899 RepID=UPI00079561FF|nr:hypothetical protein [Bordetella trematum]SAI28484.1 Uncharacterised protein [Bordetella trematum]
MSKLTKFFKTPRLFFADAKKKRIAKLQSKNKPEVAGIQPAVQKSKPNTPAGLTLAIQKKVRDDDLILAQKLLSFENAYPVNNLIADHGLIYNKTVHLWPFLRHVFWVRSQAFYKGKALAKIVTSKMYISLEWRKHYSSVANIVNVEDIQETNCDFLFFTNLRGTEQTKVDGKIYNRITDPVFEIAKNVGVSKKVEVVKSIGTVVDNRFRFNQVDLIFPSLLRRVGYREIVDIPSNFISRVEALFPEIKFTEDALRNEIEFFFSQRDFYIDLLKKYNPKVVFFVGFDYYYALVIAAKSLGIKTVDLQHGVQAGWSPVYNNWQALPADGYDLLPDYFWVWGKYDEEKIKENFPVSTVRPIIGGFPWLDRQKQLFSDQVCDAAALERVGKSSIPVGVITLQDQVEFPALFSDIITSTKNKVKWIIRRHPKHLNVGLNKLDRSVLHGKFFDNLNFSSLLSVCDIHLTECSTSVIDSDYFGVPSVVTGVQGMLNFKDFIDKGQIFHVNNPKEFLDNLSAILERRGVSRMRVIDNDGTTQHALLSLLN